MTQWHTDMNAAPRGKTTVQILKDARALIADEKNWTQDKWARDRNGDAVAPESPKAVCFCSLGALRKASVDDDGFCYAREVLRDVTKGSIIDFNDTHGHAEVLAIFDSAIARAESEVA